MATSAGRSAGTAARIRGAAVIRPLSAQSVHRRAARRRLDCEGPSAGSVPSVACRLPEQVLDDEPDVRGALAEPAHVPGKPVIAVADETADRGAGFRELVLPRRLDAVEHRELVAALRHFPL